MKIERAKMRIRISMPSKQAKQHQIKLKSLFSTIEIEDWAEDGLELVSSSQLLAFLYQRDKNCFFRSD